MHLTKPAIDYSRTLDYVTHACDLGVFQLKHESDSYDGRILTINKKDIVNFGNCSYLGLDTSETVKLGGIDAIVRYGNFFSSSRLCAGLALNEQLEDLLNRITGYHTLVTQTTTLGSLSVIPIVISPNDLIVLDHQVHASVQNAVKIAQHQGTLATMVRHNNMTALEDIILRQQNKFEKIWYLSDGLYSMLGDPCPISEMYDLMEKYPNFHCFVDDAHGLSWIGENGKGWSLHNKPLHPNMILVMSMAKGFGCCGGVIVFPTAEARHQIRCLGSSLIFSGPIPTPVLGGCIASAKLHLTEEITNRQNALHARIKYFREKSHAYGLPLVNHSFSPIFYFGGGSEENAYYLAKKLMDEGFLTGICNYPVVPKKNAGIRVSITTHNTFEDIDNLTSTMSGIISELENEGKFDKEKIYTSFRALEIV